MNCYVDLGVRGEQGWRAEVPDRLDRPLPRGLRRRPVLQLPLLPLDGPDLQKLIAERRRANPPDKYKVLGNVLDWATNVGYPGYATAGIAEAFSTWVIPTMFAKVARGDETPENAVKAAESGVQADLRPMEVDRVRWPSSRPGTSRRSSRKGELGAVNDVSLATKEGEFLVFLGPSGSGQDHSPADDRGPGNPDLGRDPDRRRRWSTT